MKNETKLSANEMSEIGSRNAIKIQAATKRVGGKMWEEVAETLPALEKFLPLFSDLLVSSRRRVCWTDY